MPGMPSPDAVRKALLNLMRIKKSNTRAQEEFQAQQRGGFEDRADADLFDMTRTDLQDARTQAQRVQRSDPLAPNPQNPLGRSNIQAARVGGVRLRTPGPAGELPGAPPPQSAVNPQQQNLNRIFEEEGPEAYDAAIGEFPPGIPAGQRRGMPKEVDAELQEWDVIIEEAGAYGQPVFATKTIQASSADEAIRKVEAEGSFPFVESDPFDGSEIQSIADVAGISDNPGFMVHAQPANAARNVEPAATKPIGQIPGVGRATLADDIDDIPF